VTKRWLIVLAVAAALVVTPPLIAARPTGTSDLPATELAARIQGSSGVAWSGVVETTGALEVPDTDSFAGVSALLGADNDLRVWWRAADDWRVDRIRSTGETDLFRRGGYLLRWESESATATAAPVSEIRLPDASDLLPASLARSVLHGARPDELARLPVRRVAGVEAPGLRLTPAEAASTVGYVDLWADPASGLPLRAAVVETDGRTVLTSVVTDLTLGMPEADLTVFRPPADSRFAYDQSVDVAAAANALADWDLPATLAGLASWSGRDPQGVGFYGRGPTSLIAIPLRREITGPLRAQLRQSPTARRTAVGTLAPRGLIGVLVTPGRLDPRGAGGSVLLAGTVDADTLQRAAGQLLARR
jgi:hypothetical protein